GHSFTVQDAPLSGLTITPPPALTAGQGTGVFTLASFVDGNVTSQGGELTATVDWGDGSKPDVLTTANGGLGFDPTTGAWDVRDAHTYASAGFFPITVTVQDANGSFTQASAVFTPAAPSGSSGPGLPTPQPSPPTLPSTGTTTIVPPTAPPSPA